MMDPSEYAKVNANREAFGSQDAPGLSKREYMATAVYGNIRFLLFGADESARLAVEAADALLAELAK